MSILIYTFLLVTVAVGTVDSQIFTPCRGQTRVMCHENVVFQKVMNGTVTLTQCTDPIIREGRATHCSECCRDFGKTMRVQLDEQQSGLRPGGICVCCFNTCL